MRSCLKKKKKKEILDPAAGVALSRAVFIFKFSLWCFRRPSSALTAAAFTPGGDGRSARLYVDSEPRIHVLTLQALYPPGCLPRPFYSVLNVKVFFLIVEEQQFTVHIKCGYRIRDYFALFF